MNSAVYTGWVQHRRLTGPGNSFRYRVFMPYLDLDELPGLLQRAWGWSSRSWALARFRREEKSKTSQRHVPRRLQLRANDAGAQFSGYLHIYRQAQRY